jgi:hypothetical protein
MTTVHGKTMIGLEQTATSKAEEAREGRHRLSRRAEELPQGEQGPRQHEPARARRDQRHDEGGSRTRRARLEDDSHSVARAAAQGGEDGAADRGRVGALNWQRIL